MKKKLIYMLGLVVCVVIAVHMFNGYKQTSIQKGIAEKIIRFHVIANSDSEVDQRIKLQVKEQVVTAMEPMLAEADSVEEVRSIIEEHMEEIEQIAQAALIQQGSTAVASAELTNCYFPVKTYGEYTFPDGEYEALRIVIGKGEGKNWWCVMYPRLCFVDSLYSVVPEQSKKELKKQLSDDEYEAILKGEKKVKVKWKILEIFGL